MKKKAIFPGSFDPFTKGHEDIVRRATTLFDEIIISIGDNSAKKRFFELPLMIQKIEQTFENTPGVSVQKFKGLTAKFAEKQQAKYIIRGLRNTTDFEFENAIAQANKKVNPHLETVFLITSPQHAYISSTITRDLYKYGGDISDFVPYKLEKREL